jgi:DNA-binding transcriptional LysR family regulator
VLSLVAIGGGVALVPELGLTDAGPDVTLAPLPMHRRTLAACRRGGRRRPAIAAFVDAMRAAAGGMSPTPSSG